MRRATRNGRPRKGSAGRDRVKNMVFYMHDVLAPAASATAVRVAAQKGKLRGSPSLGATLVFDDKLTEGPNPKSTEIGRGQGLYTLASLTSADLLLVFTAIFHRPTIYNGSTLCLHGSDRVFLPEREIGVVGGTGHFRWARGYATLSTVSFSLSSGNAIIKFNLTLLLP
ncbi:hypothetical protein L7F22_030800 [Adiantum nelumboides]|nr:hypothetical protein [Adiantum nelumboides]